MGRGQVNTAEYLRACSVVGVTPDIPPHETVGKTAVWSYDPDGDKTWVFDADD